MPSSREIVFPAPLDVVAAMILLPLAAYAIFEPPLRVFTGPAWAAWATAALIALPVTARRRWPWTALGLSGAGATAATLLGVIGAGAIWVAYVPVALILHRVAVTEPRRRSLAALGIGLLTSAAAVARLYATLGIEVRSGSAPGEPALAWPMEAGAIWVVTGASWAAGALVRRRRAAAERLSRQAVADERLRLARELHDIVGHSMSLIAVKATVAGHIAETDPRQVLPALAVIEHTSRAALTDIRRLLGVLRDDTASPADLEPAPGPDRLPELAERTRAAGVPVELEVRGADELPEAVGLSVYRIAQEALTNVVRHAAPARCRVRVEADGRTVLVEVVDDGRGRGGAEPRGGGGHGGHGGHGLIGMRERVTLYGGTLSAGPVPEGGFRVSATLPYEPRERLP
ncbi:sensor histidine kinase [Streptosporangium sp. NPDC050855]|uniref:sensor histidine kinase n=1 Tax=Streptosporangium sp. NPDC050855 TaxID=3366194 RepID=UPI0037890CCB